MKEGTQAFLEKRAREFQREVMPVSRIRHRCQRIQLRRHGSADCRREARSKRPRTRDVIRVPGSFEIPLAAKRAALSKKYDGIVALGCVLRGETPHFEYISAAVSNGLGQVALETGIPIGFGVLDRGYGAAGDGSFAANPGTRVSKRRWPLLR